MSQSDAGRRTALVQQIREKHRQDRTDFSARERNIYSKQSQTAYFQDNAADMPDKPQPGTFRIRALLAAVALVTFLLLDKNGDSLLGISTDTIADYISKDYTRLLQDEYEARFIR